jgi:hypothetical protein
MGFPDYTLVVIKDSALNSYRVVHCQRRNEQDGKYVDFWYIIENTLYRGVVSLVDGEVAVTTEGLRFADGDDIDSLNESVEDLYSRISGNTSSINAQGLRISSIERWKSTVGTAESVVHYVDCDWLDAGSGTLQNYNTLKDSIQSDNKVLLKNTQTAVSYEVDGDNLIVKFVKDNIITTYTVEKGADACSVTKTQEAIQKQLVSGTNIRTINGSSILGRGNISVQDRLVSGINIKSVNGESLLGSGDIHIDGGGTQIVIYVDYDEMIADTSQPGGTIGFDGDAEEFYIFESINEVWKKFTDVGAIDVSWWFTDTLTTQDYSRMQSIIDTGRPLMNGSCPVIVTKNSNGEIELCTLRDTTLEYTSLEELGQSSSVTISIPRTFKTINGTSIVGSGDVSTQVPQVTVTGTTPTQELSPNTFYVFGSVTSLTVILAAGVSGIANIYAFRFTAGQDNPTITLPQGVVCNQDLSLKTGDVCEFSIMDGKALFSVWEAQS